MNRFLANLTIVALIILSSYPIIKTKSLNRTLLRIASRSERAFIGVFFGGLSVLGTLAAFDAFNNIRIHSSLIGPLVGGMIGGPFVGVISAIIGSLFRYTLNNATMPYDILSILIAGFWGGLFYDKHKKKDFNLFRVYLWALSMESIDLATSMLNIQPRILSKVYLSMIGINQLIAGPIGVVILISIIKDIQYNQNLTGANYAKKSLEIAKQTLVFIKDGYNQNNMKKIAQIIYNYVDIPAVSLEDINGTSAYIGYKLTSKTPLGSSKSISKNRFEKVSPDDENADDKNKKLDYTITNYDDHSIIMAPLWLNNEVIGKLKFYISTNEIVPTDIKMIEGIASLLSLQFHTSLTQSQEKLLIEYE